MVIFTNIINLSDNILNDKYQGLITYNRITPMQWWRCDDHEASKLHLKILLTTLWHITKLKRNLFFFGWLNNIVAAVAYESVSYVKLNVHKWKVSMRVEILKLCMTSMEAEIAINQSKIKPAYIEK